MTHGLRRIRNTLRARIADDDRLAPLLALTDDQTRQIGVRRIFEGDLDLVLDGFPGSGNTFARWAFAVAQPKPIVIGGKIHSPAMLRRAVDQGLPTVLMVRNPLEVASSTVARWPWMDLQTQLQRWVRFHRSLLGRMDGLVVSPFEETVKGDFSRLVEQVNARYGTAFATASERWASPDPPGGPYKSRERDLRRASARDRLLSDPHFTRELEIANELHQRLVRGWSHGTDPPPSGERGRGS